MTNSEYKEEIFMTEEKQIIEVEYDEKLVEEFRNNYIMEEDSRNINNPAFGEKKELPMLLTALGAMVSLAFVLLLAGRK